MLWIKRNLFVAVGGLIAVVLLGYGSFYLWTNVQENKKVEADLEAKKDSMRQLYNAPIFPGKTNIDMLRDQVKRVQASIAETKRHFTPIPYENVRDKDFRVLLDNTVADLQRRAQERSVVLPAKDYSFAFLAQRSKLTFAPGSFPALSEQLAEVKTICSILFDAKINKITGLKRARLTSDDPAESTDYHQIPIHTNSPIGLASNPYIVDFQAFSGEMGVVIESFYRSTNGIALKSMTVEPAPAEVAPVGAPPAGVPPARAPVIVPQAQPGGTGNPNPGPGVIGQQRLPPGAGRPAPGSPAEAIKTVVDEKLLKVSMYLEVVKNNK